MLLNQIPIEMKKEKKMILHKESFSAPFEFLFQNKATIYSWPMARKIISSAFTAYVKPEDLHSALKASVFAGLI